MAKFNINEYKGNFVMHCKTEEEARDFCNFLHSVGRKWISGDSYVDETNYVWHQTNTAYYFNQGQYGNLQIAMQDNYTILKWSDYMEKKFTKADLKTGDVVKFRNERIGIINRELEMIITDSCWVDLGNIKNDLTLNLCFATKSDDYDIIAVRRPIEKGDCQFCAFAYEFGELIYTRPEPVEMTLAEVCKALGKEIKIVKE